MDYDYWLPGTDEPEITVRRSALGGVAVLVDGVRVRGRRGVYSVSGPDGEPHLLRVTGAWTGLRAIADGVDTPLEPPRPLWVRLLALAPLALVPLGGLVGGVLGALALAVNGVVARSTLRTTVRATVMLATLGLATAGWLAVAAALTSVAPAGKLYTTGTCLNGITPGADLVAHAPTRADCGAPHDAEVIGTFRITPAASFPGETGLFNASASQCPPLFAAYVGIDFTASKLDMVPVVPTQSSWTTGDNELACVAVAADGSKLTGSVKGTAR